MEENNQKKERRVSFAAEVETVFEYEEQRPETTISSDDDFTADLTYEGSKQLSILNETTEFIKKDLQDLVDTRDNENQEEEHKEERTLKEEETLKEERTLKENCNQEGNNMFFSQENVCNEGIKDLDLKGIKEISSSVDSPLLKPRHSPRVKKSKRTSFSPFRKNKGKKEEVKANYEQENEVNSVESSMISNNSIEATEIINTQKLKFMIPQTKKQKSNISEIFAMKGIMFLDSISFGKIRRDTLSKTRKPVDPSKILFYQNFLLHRIKFFDDFVEELKAKSQEYENQIDSFVNENEEIPEMISSEEINKNIKGMMLYARNLAKIEWYELRAKKELAFNETIIQNKNTLQNKSSELKAKHEGLRNKRETLKEKIFDLKNKIKSIKEQDEKNQADKKNIEHKIKEIGNYENLIENLNKSLEDLKIKFNKNLLHKQIQENHVNGLKKEITSLLENMREVCVNEDQLNHIKAEYDKLCAIFEISIIRIKKDLIELTFQGYRVLTGRDVYEVEYLGFNSITGQFMVEILKGLVPSNSSEFPFSSFREIFRKIYAFNEFLKDLQNLPLTNQVENSLKGKDLYFSISFKNVKICKTVHLNLLIDRRLQCTVTKDEETYLYNLFQDKGFLMNHLE